MSVCGGLARQLLPKTIVNLNSLVTPVTCQLANLTVPHNNQVQQVRQRYSFVELPKPGLGKSFRRIVHFEDKYTVKPLKITNLGGRDPVSGRVVVKTLGGGYKHPYHWIKWIRDGPSSLDEKPKEEKVLEVFKDGNRTADVALVGTGKELKYILATENMKAGDILRTSRAIPKIPVRPNEGDAYPLGALPIGTQIHCIETLPDFEYGGFWVHSAGTFAKIIRKDGDRVIVTMPSKKEFSFDKRCVATVGRLSNILHNKTHLGTPQKNRELGNRPHSGYFQKKTGRFGRKIKPKPPVKKLLQRTEEPPKIITLSVGHIWRANRLP